MLQTDVLIIGTGIAGATAALRLARNPERRVTLITRDPDPHESNTYWAQGGIIYRGPNDNADLLVKDILAAGAGASLPSAARILAEEGPKLLQEILIETAHVQFDKDDSGALAYGQEAAHSVRRIIHVADGTGAAISIGLMTALKQMPNITWFTNATAVDLITYPHHARDPLSAYQPIKCFGAYVFDYNGRSVHRTLAATTIPNQCQPGGFSFPKIKPAPIAPRLVRCSSSWTTEGRLPDSRPENRPTPPPPSSL